MVRVVRRSLAAAASMLLVLLWFPGLLPTGSANTTANAVYGGFEIDGNLYDGFANASTSTTRVNGNDDWTNLLSGPTATDPVGSADTTNFSGGSKECDNQGNCDPANWTKATGTASPKDDVSDLYVASRLVPDVNGDLWGYFGFARDAANGTTFFDFELNQHANGANGFPVRSPGDVLIVAEEQGSGAFTISGTIQRWTTNNANCASGLAATGSAGGCWTEPATLGSNAFYGLSNDSTVTRVPSGSFTAREFGEFAVDLSAAGATVDCPSTGFKALNVRTRSSISDSAEIKDYASAPIGIPSACGELKVNKYGADGTTLVPGATFTVTPNPATGTGSVTVTDGLAGDADGTANGVVDLAPAKPGIEYTVHEDTAPPGYLLPSPNTDQKVTVQKFGSGDNAAVVSFTDPLGSLTVHKTDGSSPLAGATFSLTGTGGAASGYTKTILDAASGTNSDGTADGTLTWTGLKTGTYTLHEVSAPQGYDAAADQTFTVQNSNVDATHGRDLTTSVTDTKHTTKLTVHKTEAGNASVVISGATFQLWRESGLQSGYQASAPNADTLVAGYTCTTGSDGYCTTPYSGATWPNSYYWVETSVPFPHTVPDNNVFGPVTITAANVSTTLFTTDVADPLAGISTTANGTQTLTASGATIGDTATLSGVAAHAPGTITWSLYASSDTTCSSALWTSSGTTVDGPGQYTVSHDVTAAGSYKWVATYALSASESISGGCSDPAEVEVVNKIQPTVVTTATPTNTVTGTIHDGAQLSNFEAPLGGTVTFGVYTDCAAAPLQTWTVAPDSTTGAATSGNYTTTNAHGTYYWKVTYSGDANNSPITADNCGSTAGSNHEVSHAPVLDEPVKSAVPVTGTTVSKYAPNNTIAYTITVHNSGTAAMNGVTVGDDVDADATYDAGSIGCGGDAASCVPDASGNPHLSWLFNLPAGGSATLTYSVHVATGNVDGHVIDNFASVANGTVTKSTNVTHHPIAYPTLAIDKHATPTAIEDGGSGVVTPGSSIVYDVSVANSTSGAATGVVVTDAVPVNTTYDSVNAASCVSGTTSCSVSESGGTVTWTVSIAGNTTAHLRFAVTVNAVPNGTMIHNTAHYTWNNGAQSGDSPTVSHIVEFPVISGSKDASPAPVDVNGHGGEVHPGDTVTYSIVVKNEGLTGKQVTVTDAVPPGTTYKAGSIACGAGTSGCTKDDSASPLTWTFTIAPGTSGLGGVVTPSFATVTFAVTVNSNVVNGQHILNTGVVDGTNTNTTTHVVTFPIVAVVKSSVPASTTATPVQVGPGTTIAYTLTVTNSGQQGVTGFTVRDPLPSGTTYDGNCSPNCTVENGALVWHLNLAAGSAANPTTVTLTFSVTTGNENGKLVDNTATYDNHHTDGCDAAATTCDTNTTHHEIVYPVITAAKSSNPASGESDSPAPVKPGDVITYHVDVTNSGQQDATGVHVHDAVPTGTTFTGTASNGGMLVGSSVEWVVDVPQDTTVHLTFQATVDAADANGTVITNTATYDNVHNPGECGETGCSTNTTYHVVQFPVLGIVKSADPASGSIVQRGSTIDYTLSVSNTGLAAASEVTVTDTLPDNVTLDASSVTPAADSVDGRTVTWTVDVPAQGHTDITYSVTVDADAPEGATLTNAVVVNGDCPDGSTCTTDHHVPTGNLTLVKAVDKTSAEYGGTLTYTFKAAATGALDQNDVTVTDVLPAKTSYVDGSAACTDTGTCDASYDGTSRTVTWNLGALAHGASRALTFKVTIDKPAFDTTVGLAPETIENFGNVASTETPKVESNHVKTTVVEVLGVKVVKKPRKLPFTGVGFPLVPVTGAAVGLVLVGAVLTSVRRRQH